MYVCVVDVGNGHLSAVMHISLVKPVARLPASDTDMSSDGEEYCDSFDVSSFHVRSDVQFVISV